MAVEPRRGCGFRKIGGLYLVGGQLAAPCDRLPIPLTVCPACGAGIPQARGWTWIRPFVLFGGPHEACQDRYPLCPVCDGNVIPSRAGLLWIGARFYRTAADFTMEAAALGVSRRIGAIPRGFVLGETWVYLAHPFAIPPNGVLASEDDDGAAGIFAAFRPERLEQLIPQSEATPERVTELADRGITAVPVPDDDPDHRGTVYDREPKLPGGDDATPRNE